MLGWCPCKKKQSTSLSSKTTPAILVPAQVNIVKPILRLSSEDSPGKRKTSPELKSKIQEDKKMLACPRSTKKPMYSLKNNTTPMIALNGQSIVDTLSKQKDSRMETNPSPMKAVLARPKSRNFERLADNFNSESSKMIELKSQEYLFTDSQGDIFSSTPKTLNYNIEARMDLSPNNNNNRSVLNTLEASQNSLQEKGSSALPEPLSPIEENLPSVSPGDKSLFLREQMRMNSGVDIIERIDRIDRIQEGQGKGDESIGSIGSIQEIADKFEEQSDIDNIQDYPDNTQNFADNLPISEIEQSKLGNLALNENPETLEPSKQNSFLRAKSSKSKPPKAPSSDKSSPEKSRARSPSPNQKRLKKILLEKTDGSPPRPKKGARHLQDPSDTPFLERMDNTDRLDISEGDKHTQKNLSQRRSVSTSFLGKIKVTGYRTLNYVNLLSNSKNHLRDLSEGNKKQTPETASNYLDLKSRNPKSSGKFLMRKSPNISLLLNRTVAISEGDAIQQISRNDLSALDMTIHSPNSRYSRGMKSKERESSFNPNRGMSKESNEEFPKKSWNKSHMCLDSLIEEEDDENFEQRFNKDLNTTFTRQEVYKARRNKDLGCSIKGKRTKINQYVMVQTIGKGAWGEVFLAVDINTKEKYVKIGLTQAIKVINRNNLRSRLSSENIEDALRSEIAIMKSLDHPNIIKLSEALEDETTQKIYLAMDYCSKGAVLSPEFWKAYSKSINNVLEEDFLGSDQSSNKPKGLNLKQAKKYFVGIVQALDYCRRH